MEFILGCNYWASNAGADMWRDFDAKAIEKDLEILSANGIDYLRVFPNWRDFQPVMPLYSGAGKLFDYCLEVDREPTNPYFLDEKTLDKFSVFLDLCKKYNIKLIVGLITGWMSGRLYIPSALYGKNLLTDPLALYFEQLFIKGFVTRFKNNDVIYAWDLGNECNCMGRANCEEAAQWTACISNAIKAADSSRPVVSGMHGLQTERRLPWNITDHSEFVDILTTHPYPYWGDNTRLDQNLSFRTALYPTAQTKFYSDLGEKPCLAEELGTMGSMLCNDQNSADFLRLNMFSLWANNAMGVMWWCNNDQTKLTNFPYSENMVELELGLIDNDHTPKPVLKEIKAFKKFLNDFGTNLPPAKTDAVCLLSKGQDQWGVGYMTYLLLRKNNLNCSFAYVNDRLPDSKLYIMPSISSNFVLKNKVFKELKQKVFEGADICISVDDGVLCEFESFTGIATADSCEFSETNSAVIDNTEISFERRRNYVFETTTAQVIAKDKAGNPFITVNKYGKGRVFVINAPLEKNLITCHDFEKKNYHTVYKTLLADYINKLPLTDLPDGLTATYHTVEDGVVSVILNHSSKEAALSLEGKQVLYGNPASIKPKDAVIIKLK